MPKLEVSEQTILKAAAVIIDGDLGKQTLVDYLKSLLTALWEEAEGFSGKRALGSSGWQLDVYTALVKAELIEGKLDADGDLRDWNAPQGDAVVLSVIKRFVIKG